MSYEQSLRQHYIDVRKRIESAPVIHKPKPAVRVITLRHPDPVINAVPRDRTFIFPRGMTEAWQAIVRETAAEHGVAVRDIFEGCRQKKAAAARHDAIRRVAATCVERNVSKLAAAFGMHRTTVLYVLSGRERIVASSGENSA